MKVTACYVCSAPCYPGHGTYIIMLSYPIALAGDSLSSNRLAIVNPCSKFQFFFYLVVWHRCGSTEDPRTNSDLLLKLI
jgi:uncharacterized membrane protein